MSDQHLIDKFPRARKSHRCYLCGGTIDKGVQYVLRTGVYDGAIYRDKMHAECERRTKGWDPDEWDFHDEGEFRKELQFPHVHELKIRPEYYDAIISGAKSFEIRRNDRGFAVGDVLHLREIPDWSKSWIYTGREIKVRVGYITDFCQSPGFVVMSIARVE